MKTFFKIIKKFSGLAALGACALALNAPAQIINGAVNPRNGLLFNGWVLSNAVPVVTNLSSTNAPLNFTNLLLTSAYQHNLAITTLINATNQVVPAALNHTNYFDLAKIVNTNMNLTNPLGVAISTNWTTNTPIILTSTGDGRTNSVSTVIVSSTNFDGYDLIRLTKMSENTTNNYLEQVIISQVP